MIEFHVKVDKDDIKDSYNEKNVTLTEVALIIHRLEELKLGLLDKEFENKLFIETDDEADYLDRFKDEE